MAEHVLRWLACFGKHGDGIHVDQYLWHVFSYDRFPSVRGDDALRAYVSHDSQEYVAISNDRRTGFVTNARPGPSSLTDWLVFPANLAWTMAFTHEDGWLGPFFALHPDHAHLNAENLASQRKAVEAAEARRKGWA